MALGVIASSLFLPAVRHSFVYDDELYIVQNRNVAGGVSLDGLRWAFTTTHGGYPHPLTWLSHMLDIQLFGAEPGGHHLTSIVIHALNTTLLFLALHRMTDSLWRSSLVAALFSVHPLHVESVAWVADRKGLLAAFFGLLTIVAYLGYSRRPGWKRGLLVCWLFSLSLLSKPALVALPFVLLLLDYWPLGRHRDCDALPTPRPVAGLPLVRLLMEKTPLLALAIGSSTATWISQVEHGYAISLERIPFGDRVLMALQNSITYLAKTLHPAELAVVYPRPEGTLPWWPGLAAALLLSGISVLIFRLPKRPYLIVGWLWFFGTIFPVIGLVQVGVQDVADRFTYFPLIGLFVGTTWGVAGFSNRQRGVKIVSVCLAGLALAALGAASRVQLGYWRDNETLFRHALSITPRNHVARYNLCVALVRQGRYGEAQAVGTTLLETKGKGEYNVIGLALLGMGKTDEALELFRKALELGPDDAATLNNIGLAMAAKGRHDEAVGSFQAALRNAPGDPRIHNSLGLAQASVGQFDAASESYLRALALDPRYVEAQLNLASALVSRGQIAEAEARLRTALKMAPSSASAQVALGDLHFGQNRYHEAAEHFREAIRLGPDLPGPAVKLAFILAREGRLDEGVALLEQAARRAAGDGETQYALANLLALAGRRREAGEHFREALRLQPELREVHGRLSTMQRGAGHELILEDLSREALPPPPGRSTD